MTDRTISRVGPQNLEPQREELPDRWHSNRKKRKFVIPILFLLGVATYAVPIFVIIFLKEPSIGNVRTIQLKVEPNRTKILTESLKLTADIPVGRTFGSGVFQAISERRLIFALIATIFGILLRELLIDLTEVTWSSDGSFSAQHLALARMCSSVIYFFRGALVLEERRNTELRLLVGEAQGLKGKADKEKVSRGPYDDRQDLGRSKAIKWKGVIVLAIVFHVVFYATEYFVNYAEIGATRAVATEGLPGHKLVMNLDMANEWRLFGFRKCSLMSVYRRDYTGKRLNVNSLMGCGTHFPARKVFRSGLFPYDGSRVTIRETTREDPVGEGNAVLFVSGQRRPWDENGPTREERGVLITLNPVNTLGDVDTQVRLILDDRRRKRMQESMETLLKAYENATTDPRLNIPDNQIEDEPLIEFLEAVVQNIFANSNYELRFLESLPKQGGMALGDFFYRGHVVLAFIIALFFLGLAWLTVRFWKMSFSIREVTDLADTALMALIPDRSAAVVNEALGYRWRQYIFREEKEEASLPLSRYNYSASENEGRDDTDSSQIVRARLGVCAEHDKKIELDRIELNKEVHFDSKEEYGRNQSDLSATSN